MNKTYSFKAVLMMCFMAVCCLSMVAQQRALRGDVNEDNDVNITDVTLLINCVMTSNEEGISRVGADVNYDGDINITDVTLLINYVLSGYWPEVPPEPVVYEDFMVNGVAFRMVEVEAGTFTMGATDDDLEANSWEKPAHEVTLTNDYYIAETEVTQELWQAVMGTNPTYFAPNHGYTIDLQRPVDQVTWDECQEFVAQLYALTGKKFRLPTEAEWEYAAKGGKKSHGYLYAGSNNIDEVSWYQNNSDGAPHPVATLAPNELGLYGMAGNVKEWCNDIYSSKYYTAESQVDPAGPDSGNNRSFRDGFYGSTAKNCRATIRNGIMPYLKSKETGLRLIYTK